MEFLVVCNGKNDCFSRRCPSPGILSTIRLSGVFMKRLLIIGTAIAALISGVAQAQSPTTILNASYDIAREIFAAENEAFIN